MNLLIEFLSTYGKTGAGEYHRRVVFTLLKYMQDENIKDVNIFALYDSSKEISYEDMREDTLGIEYAIKYFDIQKNSIREIIDNNRIDRFIVLCGQRIGEYPEITDVKCNVICVTHDLLFEEWYYNHLYEYWKLLLPALQLKQRVGWKWRIYFEWNSAPAKLARYIFRIHRDRLYANPMTQIANVVKMCNNNEGSKFIMVSEYSKNTMVYNYHISPNKIEVLYSPERIEVPVVSVENKCLKEIIEKREKFYLMVSCDRENKNPVKAYNAFKRFLELNPHVHFLMVGMKDRFGVCEGNIHALDFLSDSDLVWAMKSCYALVYPSFFEGFGYPPVETMKYGKPVLCSNVTSIPEILEDAPIYFTPLYESAIFQALTKLTDENYSEYAQKSLKQYQKIHKKQEADLQKLIEMLVSPIE